MTSSERDTVALLVFIIAGLIAFAPTIIAFRFRNKPTQWITVLVLNIASLAGFVFVSRPIFFIGWLAVWLLTLRNLPDAIRRKRFPTETAVVIAHVLAIITVIHIFLFQLFNIPDGGNKPALLVGDYFLASKYSYGYSRYSLSLLTSALSGHIPSNVRPQRGDVVVFRHPRKADSDFIMRVIGLPGDRIRMIGGVLHINGNPVKRERAPDFIEVAADGSRDAPVKRWKETLPNGVSYYTLDLVDNGFADNTDVFTVPVDHYFMLGDNRDNSIDSRFSEVGTVPFENLFGKAQLIIFSIYEGERAWQFWRWPISVRWTRLFTMLR